MEKALAVAKIYNQQVNQGGRATPDQHLSDLSRETQQQRLLGIQRQRGFTTPQQDFQFRQQEISQRKQLNYASWEGYQSKDQYLNSQQREAQTFGVLNQAWARRAQLIRENTDALARHQSTQGGTPNTSPGQSPVAPVAQTAVADAQAQLKKTVDAITRARVSGGGSQDSSATLSQLQAVSDAIKKIQSDAKDLNIQPKGLSDLKQGFADAQAYAGRAFPDIEAKSKDAAEGIKAKWQGTRNSFRDVFVTMRASAEDAASGVEGRFARTAASIKGSFSGIGGGAGGGGIAAAFGDMANTVGSLAQNIPGMVGLITAAILALIQILPALAAGLGAIGSVAATLPDFLGAAGGAFVTFQAAIMPVISALGKYAALLSAQESVQAGTTAAVMQQQQAYHSLADAQFSLAQAVVGGSNQQVTAAHAVTDAQYSLRQAYFQAGITQQQSTMEVAGSLHSLQDAQFSVTQSQYQLNIAWQQARFQLAQLELQVSSASLSLRGAQLGLEQAQQNYATVMASSTSTALDRAQAAYQIQVAEQSLKQVQLTNTQNEQQLANVRKYGMKQVFGVTAAQHALVDAQFSEIQAQKQLVITQKDAANAQIQSAHAITDAIFGVSQARFQEAQGATQSAHQISDAQFSVAQAQLQLRDDAQAGGAAAASAYDALQVALAQLSPAAKQAVKDLGPIFVWWNNNTKAQQAFFGEFDKSLNRLGTNDVGLIKPLNTMLDSIARTLGTVGGKFVDWLASLAKSPMWALFTRTSVTIISDLGNGALYFAKGMAEVAKIAAPLATWMAGGLERLAKSFLAWANSQAKPGSMLNLLLTEAKPALEALGQLLKSIVLFFGILAGGTPQFSKQGVLTGVIPSDSQNSAFKTFLLLLGSLSNTILPNLALLLNKLASPQLANALINLLDALSTLLLQVVSSPGFLAGFTAFVSAFTVLVGLFGSLVSYTPLGSLIGVLAGAFVAMSVLKFTGILALLANLFKIKDWIGGIRSAEGILGKIGAIFSKGGGDAGLAGSAQSAADTLAAGGVQAGENLVASATEAANILAGGGAKAGAEETAGAAASSEEMAAGGAASAKSLIGGLLGKAGLAAIITQFLVVPLLNQIKVKVGGRTEGAWTATGPQPGGKNDNWFNSWSGLGNTITKFFAHTLPGYIASLPPVWGKAWANVGSKFMQFIGDPVAHFFAQRLPDWLGGAGQGWKGMWANASNFFSNDIGQPLGNFFLSTVPGWFSRTGKFWKNLWDNAWGDFKSGILDPVANFFTHTLPGTIENAFKGSVNWVITNVINRVIGWINAIIGKIPGVSTISTVATIHAGGGDVPRLMATGGPFQQMPGRGSVPGAGDFDSQPTILTPGEWVIRKPARMAIDQKMGPGFLQFLNHFDAQAAATGGEIVSFADQFVGKTPYVWGGTTPAGWDCSGFTDYVYHHFGYNAPRTSEQQWQWVRKTKTPEVGGLVFGAGSDGTAASPGHVGIVTGPNSMVDAYGTGFGTRFNTISGSMGPVSGFGIPPSAGGSSFSLGGFGKSALHAFGAIFGGLGGLLNRAESVLKAGALKGFDWLWGHTVSPLENRLGITGGKGSIPGNLAAKGLDSVRKMVVRLLSTSGAGAPHSAGPATADAAVAQQYARSQLSRYGWGPGEFAPLDALWTRESNWDRYAMNPTSGAFGIPQALPWTKMPKVAWPVSAGGQAAAGAQIDWGLGYIKSRPGYGSPSAAEAHEQAFGWYAGGGPVDPNAGHPDVPWYAQIQYPSDVPSPGMHRGGGVRHRRDRHSRDKHGRPWPPVPGPYGGKPVTPGPLGVPPVLTPPPSGGMSLAGLLPWLPQQSFAGGGPVGLPPMAFAGLPSLSLSAPRVPPMAYGGSQPDRVLSTAGASGKGGGITTGDITINNPIREPAGESLTRAVMKLGFLAGRGTI